VAQLQAQLQTLRDLEAGTVRLWRSRVRELKAQLTDLQAQYGEQSDLVEQLEDELQALAEGRQGIKALDLLLLSLQQRDTTEEQRAAAAGTVDLIYRRHKQLHALLTSHEFGEGGVPGCAAAALCCFFVWGRVSSSKELGAVYRRLSQIVHSDGVRVLGDEEETKMLNAMEDRLSLLL
jgi:hypothetical protein